MTDADSLSLSHFREQCNVVLYHSIRSFFFVSVLYEHPDNKTSLFRRCPLYFSIYLIAFLAPNTGVPFKHFV